ncbi:hypothetical protein EVAR_24472_1 [Eumeta japonica]|uniref:Uncharacterized protein n=1 Tax=Eumeta variegata TaxID=151549 RepID=A0A4C1WUR6_EUMVA|nr:hypothetical protein EVAR_24472_1 [Eumeta japonica]
MINPTQIIGYEKTALAVDPSQFDRGTKNGPRHLVKCHAYQIQGRGVKFGVGHSNRAAVNRRWKASASHRKVTGSTLALTEFIDKIANLVNLNRSLRAIREHVEPSVADVIGAGPAWTA